ncbi:MAG: hypothetical protein BAJATHORv1_30160 [Candidatus Thorarchaeota archaeon]|nr:MAG: hypothetical protein BAJATHORv1_30160 [Candidatus Thorarchaeota archaeon]
MHLAVDVSRIRYISIIRLEGGESILSLPYATMTVDPDLIAGFVTAVIIFAKTPIRTIRKAAYDILIEVGKKVLILLVVDPVPDEAPYRKHLRQILSDFETGYQEALADFDGDVRLFREFCFSVLVHFPYHKIDLELVPLKRRGEQIPYRVGYVDQKMEEFEDFINGKRSLGEIVNRIALTDGEVMAVASALAKFKWIHFKKPLTDNDILIRLECEPMVLERLKAQYGQPVEDLIRSSDGSQRIQDIMQGLPYDSSAIWFLINLLVDSGCLGLAGIKSLA